MYDFVSYRLFIGKSQSTSRLTKTCFTKLKQLLVFYCLAHVIYVVKEEVLVDGIKVCFITVNGITLKSNLAIFQVFLSHFFHILIRICCFSL